MKKYKDFYNDINMKILPSDKNKKILEEVRVRIIEILHREYLLQSSEAETRRFGEIVESLQVEALLSLFSEKLQEERESLIYEIREKFVDLAIEGKDDEDEWKGAHLYVKTLKYLDKLKSEEKKE